MYYVAPRSWTQQGSISASFVFVSVLCRGFGTCLCIRSIREDITKIPPPGLTLDQLNQNMDPFLQAVLMCSHSLKSLIYYPFSQTLSLLILITAPGSQILVISSYFNWANWSQSEYSNTDQSNCKCHILPIILCLVWSLNVDGFHIVGWLVPSFSYSFVCCLPNLSYCGWKYLKNIVGGSLPQGADGLG